MVTKVCHLQEKVTQTNSIICFLDDTIVFLVKLNLNNMSYCNSNSSITSSLSNYSKIQALESTLHQSLVYFKELLQDIEHLHVESENYKTQFQLQKEKCESKTCCGSDELKKEIESKNNLLQSLAATLTRLYETKDFNLINEAFQIICGEVNVPQTVIKTSPKTQESNELTDEISNDETLNEIEGTPSGRTSPIIHTKKTRNYATAKSSDYRDKKKCPDNWDTPEKKTIKLLFPQKATTPTRKPGGRLKQARLNLVKVKQTHIVDLTCSPEFAGGLRTPNTENNVKDSQIKREFIDNDDTILPSPTSGPDQFTLFKSHSITKSSPFKKPQLSLKPKNDRSRLQFEDVENKPIVNVNKDQNDMEESINILQHLHARYTGSPKKLPSNVAPCEDTTYCDTNMSISLLQNVNNLDEQNKHCSPPKGPLAENKNIVNTPPKASGESSSHRAAALDNVKRCIPELVEPLYKEPTLRKKADKRALPGWCCDDCQRFYGALYSDDPVMMARKIEQCSKHRAAHNPTRHHTPPNFWNPRWNVPEDTEELNRMNNAV